MIDLTNVKHHPALDDLVNVLCAKTQNTNRSFFSVEVAYFLGKMASSMHATIVTRDRGKIPVNIFALALAVSGFGKGHSVTIMERDFLQPFQNRFMDDTFPMIAEKSLWHMANDRSARTGLDAQKCYDKLLQEFQQAGPFPFTFDSGTTPAVKQLRQKLLMAGAGSINLQVDEISLNLTQSIEVLTTFLELYDQGLLKQKLTKQTNENNRGEDLNGRTPTNMLLFGSPAKLLDGGATEDQFHTMLEVGYARRCLFGFGTIDRSTLTQTPEEIYDTLIDPAVAAATNKWAAHFHKLADPARFGWEMSVPDDVAIKLIEYRLLCEHYATTLPEHEETRRAEISHRYSKALKLAGAYAYIDESTEVEMDHLLSAILLVEESGASFQRILTREKPHARLAKYIADVTSEQTHADLHEALPFYRSGRGGINRTELMTLAIAWGYKHNIIIRKRFVDGIELFEGDRLQETDINSLIISHSDNFAYNYQAERAPFDQLHVLAQLPDHHWATHEFRGEHRTEENAIEGFNMLVLDVDGTASVQMVCELLKEYRFFIYTTKRHTNEAHRFRIVLPLSHTLKMNAEDYKEFYGNIIDWLPFQVDENCGQRSRKWSSHPGGYYHYNLEGELLSPMDFIPRTARNDAYLNQTKELQSLDSLERWFAQRMVHGNRNNHMIRFALALVDSGQNLIEVSNAVRSFNKKLSNPLPETEIQSTVLTTVAKRYTP